MTGNQLRHIEAFPLVELVAYGTDEQTFAPGLGEDGSIVLAPDETVAWEAKSQVKGQIALDGRSFRNVWDPGFIQVLVTDQRLIYWQEKFDRGRTYAPLTGGVPGMVLSAVSHFRAAKRNRANALSMAAGQLRYENVDGLETSTRTALIGQGADRYLSFDARTSGAGVVRVVLLCTKADPRLENYVRRNASTVAGREIPLMAKE